MAQFGKEITRSADAAADLRAVGEVFLRGTGANAVNVASNAAVAGSNILGVLDNKPNSGQTAAIVWFGETKVIAGASTAVHLPLTTNSSGRAIAATSGDMVIGLALEAAGADGERIRVLVHPPYPLTQTMGA